MWVESTDKGRYTGCRSKGMLDRGHTAPWYEALVSTWRDEGVSMCSYGHKTTLLVLGRGGLFMLVVFNHIGVNWRDVLVVFRRRRVGGILEVRIRIRAVIIIFFFVLVAVL